jgi:hypothetical protein
MHEPDGLPGGALHFILAREAEDPVPGVPAVMHYQNTTEPTDGIMFQTTSPTFQVPADGTPVPIFKHGDTNNAA